MTSPLELYGEGLLTAASGTPSGTWLRYEDGGLDVLDLPRWSAPAAGADGALLDRCTGPVLDLGCGPGRLMRALAARGLECLGVDVAPVAVALARTGGVAVLQASVFDPVLDDSRWSTVLLADGNVGIGGDPAALLARCRGLLLDGGQVLVELDPPGCPTRTVRVRVETLLGRSSSWFPWAHVGVDDVDAVAAAAGLGRSETWHMGSRWFAVLRDGSAA